MTTNNTEDRGRAGQGGEGAGVDPETGELSQAGLEARRALDSFLGRAPVGGGQAPRGAGKRRKSKPKRSGGLSPIVKRLLRLFLWVRAIQIYPLVGLIAPFGGSSSRRRGKGRSRRIAAGRRPGAATAAGNRKGR